MALIFKKKQRGSDGGSKCDLLVSVSPYRRGTSTDCLALRLSAELLARSGWKVGDRCIPAYDAGTWTLIRTTDAKDGYRLSQSQKSQGRTANIKMSLTKDEQIELGMRRGDRRECDVTEASQEKIVAVLRR